MMNKLLFSSYDNALINIIQKAEDGILEIANNEYDIPFTDNISKEEKGRRNRRLSQAWVKYLSFSLEEYHREKNDKIYAFPGNPKLAKEHGIKRKEFLFDISVGEYNHFDSTVHDKPIYYQSEPLWQIESELAYNMVDMAIDFSKLIAGNAPYKMMVGPVGKKKSKYYLQDMRPLAKKITDLLYFLFIPRPNKWLNENESKKWYLHKWYNSDWKKVKKGEWNFIE